MQSREDKDDVPVDADFDLTSKQDTDVISIDSQDARCTGDGNSDKAQAGQDGADRRTKAHHSD